MNALVPNPETGFLESKNPITNEAFDSDKKVKFLALARKSFESGKWPRTHDLCRAVGIKNTSFYSHLSLDPKFCAEWEETKHIAKSWMTGELASKALRKMGTLANIAMLRYLESGTWLNTEKSQFHQNTVSSKEVLSRFDDVIDAEIVDNQGNNNLIDNKP